MSLPKFLISLCAAFFVSGAGSICESAELAVGRDASINQEISIPLTGPAVLNGRTRSEIFGARAGALARFNLLKGSYSPSEAVFGQVEDRKPWWGYYGMYVWREGNRSPEGPSKESRFILNPYLLVGADPTNIGLIMPRKVNDDILRKPNFPFVWEPTALVWNPKQRRAQVTYDLSGYQRRVKEFLPYLKGDYFINKFSLIAYNARDLGFSYIYPAVENSANVANRFTERKPIMIKQMLHCGGSCGYPGGCNNMSPLMPELDYMQLTGMPASLTLYLWKKEPSSVDQTPDFTYVINFK